MNFTQIAAVAAFTAGIAVGAGGAWKWQASRVASAQLGLKNEQLNRVSERISQERAARTAMERATNAVVVAQNAAAVRVATVSRESDLARGELERLRGSIAGALQGANVSLAACSERATAIGGLLDQCATAYQELGRRADGHAGDVRTLMEAWPVAGAGGK